MAGCAPPDGDFGIDIRSVTVRDATTGPTLTVRQKVTLSRDARRALESGVPLVIEVQGRVDGASASRRFEIRYLPLSDHFQVLEGSELVLGTYPRLRHALAALSDVMLTLPDGILPEADAEAEARTRLLVSELPRPMRLPAWLSGGWRHDSGWRTSTRRATERT